MGSRGTSAEMRSTTLIPASSRASTFSGLLVMRRTAWTPSCLRISAGSSKCAAVGFVAEFEVGFDGVEALVLEFVGAELGHQSDAAAFLLLVEEDAGAGVGDGERGRVRAAGGSRSAGSGRRLR